MIVVTLGKAPESLQILTHINVHFGNHGCKLRGIWVISESHLKDLQSLLTFSFNS